MARWVFAAMIIVAVLPTWRQPADADVTYTITLTDEQSAALQEQTDLVNKMRRNMARAKQQPPVDLTPEAILKNATINIVEAWEDGQHQTSVAKPWADRSTREKKMHCRRQKLDPCPR